MKRSFFLSLTLVAAALLAACAPQPAAEPTVVPEPVVTEEPVVVEPTVMPEPEPQTIVDIASSDGNFTTLVTALEAADLVDALEGEGPFTVFAPTDDAFAALPEGTVQSLLEDIPSLTNVLLYHVVDGAVLAEDVVNLDAATTLLGEDVVVTIDGDVVKINNAEVVITDILASNGVIHVIDTVLVPETPMDIVDTAIADGRFSTLVTALEAADLVDTLKGEGPFTVFAPTDDAFAALPEGTVEGLLNDIPALTEVLLYHVVDGSVMAEDVVTLDSATALNGDDVMVVVDGDTVKINDAQVVITDIETTNGVIHVIDSVLLPPQPMDIVDTAIADGRFTTLVAAVDAAGLVDALKSEGPFTVFAPTDDAFAALPEGTVEALLADIPTLTNILLYHVVEGKVMAADVVMLDSADTLLGQSLAISVDGDSVKINDSQVIITDIETSNGVIHVIDSVLLPEG